MHLKVSSILKEMADLNEKLKGALEEINYDTPVRKNGVLTENHYKLSKIFVGDTSVTLANKVSTIRGGYTVRTTVPVERVVDILKYSIGHIIDGNTISDLKTFFRHSYKNPEEWALLNALPVNSIRTNFQHTLVDRLRTHARRSLFQANVIAGRNPSSSVTRVCNRDAITNMMICPFAIYVLLQYNGKEETIDLVKAMVGESVLEKYCPNGKIEHELSFYREHAIDAIYSYLAFEIKKTS